MPRNKLDPKEFIKEFISPNLEKYANMRNILSWYFSTFFNKELSQTKKDKIITLKQTLEMLTNPNLGKIFLILYLSYINTFKTSSGKKFTGSDGYFGESLKICLLNIMRATKGNISNLKNEINNTKKIPLEECYNEEWLSISFKNINPDPTIPKSFECARDEATNFAKQLHQTFFKK